MIFYSSWFWIKYSFPFLPSEVKFTQSLVSLPVSAPQVGVQDLEVGYHGVGMVAEGVGSSFAAHDRAFVENPIIAFHPVPPETQK